MALTMNVPFSSGEKKMHRLLGAQSEWNPAAATLTRQAVMMLEEAPLLAIGTIDSQARPWTTVLGGRPGFARGLGKRGMISVETAVESEYDPVVQALAGEHGGRRKMFAGLTIDLVTRERVKIAGRTVSMRWNNDVQGGSKEAEFRFIVDQSLGNCPKYINSKEVFPVQSNASLISDSPRLTQEALDLLNRADLFFLSTSNGETDMDTNNRGGPPGFVRVCSNDDSGAEIIWPEYSGNKLYATLGNLQSTPRAGLVFPDFETGDVLYLTGRTQVLFGSEAADILPRSNLAVKVKIDAARFVREGLVFRGVATEPSPYTPDLRLLASEGNLKMSSSLSSSAECVARHPITPTITRYRYRLDKPAAIKPGQWVALDFSPQLDQGYSHMRDDDPRSLNDDYIRTFTVSSQPSGVTEHEFEVTVRRSGGPVTAFMAAAALATLRVAVRGFGGDFAIVPSPSDDLLPFVAGGVGITPVLGQLGKLDLSRFRLFWTIRFEDLDLVANTIGGCPALAPLTRLYLTHTPVVLDPAQKAKLDRIRGGLVDVQMRRLAASDLSLVAAERWYLCASKELRAAILSWLKGKTVLYESFDY